MPRRAAPTSAKESGVDCEAEQRDEVVALEAIFGDDYAALPVLDNERHRFGLAIKPCPGEPDAENAAVVRMLVGLPWQYPLHPPKVGFELVRGLGDASFRELCALTEQRVAQHWG